MGRKTLCLGPTVTGDCIVQGEIAVGEENAGVADRELPRDTVTNQSLSSIHQQCVYLANYSDLDIVNVFRNYYRSVYEWYVYQLSVKSDALQGPCLAGVSCLTMLRLCYWNIQGDIKKLK